MEIRHFGPGHRRPDGPPGTRGITGRVIHSDERGVVSELAFSRYGLIPPHSNPNLTLFVVISGAGFVQVGAERSPVNHGEAVVWPPDVDHGAYTDGVEMRAIVIELPESAGQGIRGRDAVLQVPARPKEEQAGTPSAARTADPPVPPSAPPTPEQEGLAERQIRREEYDAAEGEPW